MPALLIAQDQAEGNLPYGARINAALIALGPIGISGFVFQHRSQGVGALSLSYSASGQTAARAAAFEGSAASSASAQATAFLAANPTYIPLLVRDIGNQRERSLSRDVILLVYSIAGMPNCGQGLGSLAVVRSLAIIAPGATGNVTQVTAAGLSGTYAVVNRSTASWALGVDGYAQARAGSCILDGFPQAC